ncbi:hypothetical protein [Paenibacillus sp. Leaf72]|uniref:hypothetical protein n=1 Tax=Paenibacillus sp. Leaf72 TaxID=1736234 RepID=UPI0006FCF1FD|nr:hypothetical protein [Paenibacillus sp. Leaf72]KQN96167.1 hypothetical protein ASF12_25450 [Paenibacillus sp. Leaf72]
MIGDPEYLADLARCELPFFTMVHHPQVQAEIWVKKMEQIHVRASEALKKQWPAQPFSETDASSFSLAEKVTSSVMLRYTLSGCLYRRKASTIVYFENELSKPYIPSHIVELYSNKSVKIPAKVAEPQ